jgi:SAM-dependent methyltransferase
MPDHPAAARIIPLYQQHAAIWDASRRGGTMERAWLDRFIALLSAGGSVLDIGCGAGDPIDVYLAGQGLDVAGVDGAPSMIELCRHRLPQGTWRVGDMRTLDLGLRFDGVVAWDSFFHLTAEDQRRALGVFRKHAGDHAALMFTSGPAAGEAIGTWQGEALYHASLDPTEYRALLDGLGFDVVTYVANDPACGGHTIWLARSR